jgi:putative membrane protein
MMGYWFGGMGWWMALAGILCVLFWGGLIWLGVWGITKATGHGNSTAAINNPLEIAKGRYAKSEITKEQFDQIKKDLN